jgi:hypothetical protein
VLMVSSIFFDVSLVVLVIVQSHALRTRGDRECRISGKHFIMASGSGAVAEDSSEWF